MDTDFTATETFSLFDVSPLPAGFCGDTIDTAQAELETAVKEFNDAAAFAEWLQLRQNDELLPVIESGVNDRAAEVTGAISTVTDSIDAKIQALFDEDQMSASPMWIDFNAAKSFLEIEFNQALGGLTMEDSG